jgi:hypothetical protein
MPGFFVRYVLCLISLLCTVSITHASAEVLPSEPGEELLVNEDVNIVNGLYMREYSLRGDGVVDYRTARQIIRSEYNDYGDTVVEAMAHPLFYWYDARETGAFSMWIDPKGEGCTCDIVPYIALAGDLGQ